MSNSSSTSDDRRESLLETLQGYKVRTAPSQLFPGQCGVVALAPIAKGESVFPCNGELSNDVINLTFEEVASLPSHSRKLVWAFFQPNQDPRSVPREELTFPVPVNGLAHAGSSFFCNSSDGTGQDANVETGTRIDGSGYAELVAMKDIQVGEELLDSYTIWDYDGGNEEATAAGELNVEDPALNLLGIGTDEDESREILHLRRHMANLKAKVARLKELKKSNEGEIAGLKRQNGALASNCRLWWDHINSIGASVRNVKRSKYRDDANESDSDHEVDDNISFDPANCEPRVFSDIVSVDIGQLKLDDSIPKNIGGESKGNDSGTRSLELMGLQDDDTSGGVGVIEDAIEEMNQDVGGDDFPPPPPLPGQVEVGISPVARANNGCSKPNDQLWHQRLGELREYKEENGHCNGCNSSISISSIRGEELRQGQTKTIPYAKKEAGIRVCRHGVSIGGNDGGNKRRKLLVETDAPVGVIQEKVYASMKEKLGKYMERTCHPTDVGEVFQLEMARTLSEEMEREQNEDGSWCTKGPTVTRYMCGGCCPDQLPMMKHSFLRHIRRESTTKPPCHLHTWVAANGGGDGDADDDDGDAAAAASSRRKMLEKHLLDCCKLECFRYTCGKYVITIEPKIRHMQGNN